MTFEGTFQPELVYDSMIVTLQLHWITADCSSDRQLSPVQFIQHIQASVLSTSSYPVLYACDLGC